MDMMKSPEEELSFLIEGAQNIWKLIGIHPRFGPSWAHIIQSDEEITHKITGSVGDIFKIESSDLDYTFVSIAEGGILKEINYIVFEDFAYSISRRWYNVLKNIGVFKGNLDEDD
jgi:hypothetical protein